MELKFTILILYSHGIVLISLLNIMQLFLFCLMKDIHLMNQKKYDNGIVYSYKRNIL